ncbi:MAG: radical SAM protein [Thermoplasmata archaeon]
MTRPIDIFRPGRSFPAVSVTGARCDLQCHHCAGHYLHGMRAATEPEGLLRLALELDEAGALGMLISGGSDTTGKVPLERFVGTIRRIKDTTRLKLNAHVGLAPRSDLENLVAAGVDAFSVDVYGTDSAVQDTLGLDACADDFMKVIEDLKDLDAPAVAPHICIGVEKGVLAGEMDAIARLKPIGPDALVFIVFTPTKGTSYEKAPPPAPSDIISVLRLAREQLPDTRLVLGCMRPRMARQYELEAVALGIDGIVMPSRATLKYIRRSGANISEKETCCALG